MRSRLIISLFLVTGVGLYSKVYRGWGYRWVNYSSGGILYVIFWCLLFFAIFPSRKNRWQIPFLVFSATCLLEVLQIWRSPWLEAIRSTELGHLILGTTFAWDDFTYYAIGTVLGWFWLGITYSFGEKR